jgi:hypothetical protein
VKMCANSESQLSKNHKTIFSFVNEPLSWSDADNSLGSMSDPEEDEGDMPDDKDSLHSGVGDADAEGGANVDIVADVLADGDGDAREGEAEDSSYHFLDAGEGAVIPDRLSFRAASEIGQSGSGGGTEDDPVVP